MLNILANDPRLTEKAKSLELYSRINNRIKHPLNAGLKKDYNTFRRLCKIYSKKGSNI